MKNLAKDVKAINTQLKALIKKTDALIKAAGLSKSEPAPPKPKTILRKKKAAPVKTKPKSTRKTTAKATGKATGKKPRHSSSTELALKIIRQHKKGIDVETLQKKTRFDEKKISNIVHRAFKKGLIKRAGRGIYKI